MHSYNKQITILPNSFSLLWMRLATVLALLAAGTYNSNRIKESGHDQVKLHAITGQDRVFWISWAVLLHSFIGTPSQGVEEASPTLYRYQLSIMMGSVASRKSVWRSMASLEPPPGEQNVICSSCPLSCQRPGQSYNGCETRSAWIPH